MRGIFERANLDIAPSSIASSNSEPAIRSNITAESPESMSYLDAQPTLHTVPIKYPTIGPSTRSTPVLDRIRCGYNVMTRIRKTSELCVRPMVNFVHPNDIDENTFPIISGTHGSTFRVTQILISSIFDFASISFPEFETLSSNEKWHIVSGCYDRIHVIESHFRAQKIFPNDDRIFVSYTTTLSTDTIDVFLSDYVGKTNIEESTIALRSLLDANAGSGKRAMRRVAPTDDEFLILLALSFWNTESPYGDERLSLIATASRAAIMQDLHSYYSNKGMSEYATRIGQLFCLLVATEKVTSLILEDIELLRLMDVNQQPRF